MKIDTVPIVQTAVCKGVLQIDWKDDSFSRWPELVNSEQFVDLQKKANEKLKDAIEKGSKGKGSGKA